MAGENRLLGDALGLYYPWLLSRELSLFPSSHEPSSFLCHVLPPWCPSTSPRAQGNEVSWLWTKPLKPGVQVNFSSPKGFSSDLLVTVIKSWLKQSPLRTWMFSASNTQIVIFARPIIQNCAEKPLRQYSESMKDCHTQHKWTTPFWEGQLVKWIS